jgi:hypothetical protein
LLSCKCATQQKVIRITKAGYIIFIFLTLPSYPSPHGEGRCCITNPGIYWYHINNNKIPGKKGSLKSKSLRRGGDRGLVLLFKISPLPCFYKFHPCSRVKNILRGESASVVSFCSNIFQLYVGCFTAIRLCTLHQGSSFCN